MSRPKKLLFLFLLLAMTLVAAEVGVRVLLAVTGKPYSASDTYRFLDTAMRSFTEMLPAEEEESEIGAASGAGETTGGTDAGAQPGEPVGASTDREAPIPHPYYGFERNTAKLHRTIEYLTSAKSDDEYTIVIFGGSVAAGFCNKGRDTLIRLLGESDRFDGRQVVVLRYAHAAFKQPQQVAALAYLLGLGLRPDAVLNLDGVNEVALGLSNSRSGVHPAFPSSTHWSSVASGGIDRDRVTDLLDMREAERKAIRSGKRALALRLHRSAILGKLARALMSRHRGAWVRAYESYLGTLGEEVESIALTGPPSVSGDDAALHAAARTWRESSLSMQAMCAARGIDYFHVLQPTLHDVGSKTWTEEERATSGVSSYWIDGAGRGYPMLREEGERLVDAGVWFYDASYVFRDVSDTLYYDHCHFNRKGNVRLAIFMVERMLEDLGSR